MLITNIGRIYGTDYADAWLLTAGERIAAMGSMAQLPQTVDEQEIVDARGGWALPSFCDSHTHIVYAGSRHGEFIDKIDGLTYEQIAARGGGILNSADLLARTSEADLFAQSLARAREVMAKGTGAIEIKSGYGLTVASELKMLRVIARIAQAVPMCVRASFLGAHAVGRAFAGRQQAYVDHLVAEMLPAVAAEGLADFVDVFCDDGFFTPEQTAQILEAAAHYGLRPKIHACELANSGGVEVGIAHGALSVDHLERAEAPQLAALAASKTVATMLPGASFFLGMPYAPARQALEAGCTVALASDYNPGSSPSGDMRFVWTLGCIKMRLHPHQALDACTRAGAQAMGIDADYGSLTPGRMANIVITTPIDDLAQIPYQYTTPWINRLILKGKELKN